MFATHNSSIKIILREPFCLCFEYYQGKFFFFFYFGNDINTLRVNIIKLLILMDVYLFHVPTYNYLKKY